MTQQAVAPLDPARLSPQQLGNALPADALERLLAEGANLGDAALTEECLRIAAST